MTRAPLARRGYLGSEVELDDAGGPPGRLVVGRVDEGSPSARGGVQVGDVLVAIAGQPVIDLRAARSLAARLPAGQGAELGFLRDGHPIALAVDVEPMPLEPLANGWVELGEVLVLQEDGGPQRLRSIWTFPDGEGPHPAVWLLPSLAWVSCEHPRSTWHPTFQLVQGLTAAGFATMRVDRSGLGDSEGPPCTELDFEAEMRGWRAALAHFCAEPRVRASARHLFGRSLGGVLAALLARQPAFASVVVWGTSAQPWHDALLKSSARQLALGGLGGAELERRLTRLCELQELVYLRGLTPDEAYAKRPDLADVQPSDFAGSQVYDRDARFFQQLQAQDIAGAWQQVRCPVLAIFAACDFLTSADDLREIAELAPKGRFTELPGVDHFMHERPSLAAAFREPWGGAFSGRAVTTLVDFFRAHG